MKLNIAVPQAPENKINSFLVQKMKKSSILYFMNKTNVIIKGDICYSKTLKELETVENGYLVCEDGTVQGVFAQIPEKYQSFPLKDYSGNLIIPGLIDLHTHAPQYAYRGLGMDMQLLDWLDTYTFPEESKYIHIDYANKSYNLFVNALKSGATTRALIFATLHTPATLLLMEKLEQTGLITMVGKVGMDRNCPDTLRQESAEAAYISTKSWIESSLKSFKNTKPIITPRFIPTCSDELMQKFKHLQEIYSLAVQSHLSENHGEIEWVKKLNPSANTYAHAYEQFGLFGGKNVKTVMAHCVWSEGEEEQLIFDNNVYVAHCPASNTHLASGIAPVRRFLEKGINVGLGSDIAGGPHLSIFRAISSAVEASKMYWRLIDQNSPPLTLNEAFYLATTCGGSFFSKVGKFEHGYELDAIIVDDSKIPTTNPLKPEERLARVIYYSDDNHIIQKYVNGKEVFSIE